MEVEYHPAVVSDLNQGFSWYETHHAGLGAQFREEVYTAIDSIRENPKRYPRFRGGVRQCLVHRFPWTILYRVIKRRATVRVLVIRHQRRQPLHGLGRR